MLSLIKTTKIKVLSSLSNILIILVILSLISIAFVVLIYERKQVLIDNNRFISHQLSDNLLQSSDDLTRMARTYINTGDTLYKNYYFAILDIRNGEIPRPEIYSKAYWWIGSDSIKSESLIPTSGDTVALVTLMQQAGFLDEELALLVSSKARSNALVNLEKEAFAAVDGLFADDQGNFTIKKTPDPDFGRVLLHGKAYNDGKEGIMEPIVQFQEMVDKRGVKESVHISNILKFWILVS